MDEELTKHAIVDSVDFEKLGVSIPSHAQAAAVLDVTGWLVASTGASVVVWPLVSAVEHSREMWPAWPHL